MLNQIAPLTEENLDVVWDLCQRYEHIDVAVLAKPSRGHFMDVLFKALQTQESRVHKSVSNVGSVKYVLFDTCSIIKWQTQYNCLHGVFDFVLYDEGISEEVLRAIRQNVQTEHYNDIMFAEEIGFDLGKYNAKDLL